MNRDLSPGCALPPLPRVENCRRGWKITMCNPKVDVDRDHSLQQRSLLTWTNRGLHSDTNGVKASLCATEEKKSKIT